LSDVKFIDQVFWNVIGLAAALVVAPR